MTVGELKIKLSADAGDLDRGMADAKTALGNIGKSGSSTAGKLQKTVSEIAGSIKGQSNAVKEAGEMMFKALDDALLSAGEDIIKSSDSLMKDVVFNLSGYAGDMQNVGENLMSGIGIGIAQSSGQIKEQIKSMGQSVLSEIKNVFEIASPSKKTAYLGQMIGEGLAAGISDSLKKVELSAGSMYSAATEAAQTSSYTYNTYNSTYNAGANTSDNVKLADFENRLRRAYG